MTDLIELNAADACDYLLKEECYVRHDFPPYISFQSIIDGVAGILGDKSYSGFQSKSPQNCFGVNYPLTANKDGRLAWRPFEIIHPVIYVSLVNTICNEDNWKLIQQRFAEFRASIVVSCGHPIVPKDQVTTVDGAQILNWWRTYEQKSLELSLEYTHMLQSDVTDCYGSIYTHSIAWALHGYIDAKANRRENTWLGNKIDRHIQACRYGQTNGIVQGSVLMDLIAELVLGYVDLEISKRLGDIPKIHILRYRDDYRIFSLDDSTGEHALKTISDCLQDVGMKLGAAKTSSSTNIVEASIKPEKLAGLQLEDMDIKEAKTIQKQLLRLHAFARKHPNSGALNRLTSNAFEKIRLIKDTPDDINVQVAIATDIASISPQVFPAISGVLAKLISLAPKDKREYLWNKVDAKMKRIPHNSYLEIWLQRVTRAKGVDLIFESNEAICKIVDGQHDISLWNNEWISNQDLISALSSTHIMTGKPEQLQQVPEISEISLFQKYAEFS